MAPTRVTPQVLAILAEYGAVASFFCIGQRVAAAPELARAIVAAGHAVENHGQRHHTFKNRAQWPGGLGGERLDAQASIEAATGQRPRFYRPTAGLRNPFLGPGSARTGSETGELDLMASDTPQHGPGQASRR